MKRRINEDFLPTSTAPLPPAGSAVSNVIGGVPKPHASARFFNNKPRGANSSGAAVENSSLNSRQAAVTVKPPRFTAKKPSVPTQSSRTLRSAGRQPSPPPLLDPVEELSECMENAPLLGDSTPIVASSDEDNSELAQSREREAKLLRQLELLNLDTIPALERKLKQSETARLEDVKKLVFAVKSERAQHAKQMEEIKLAIAEKGDSSDQVVAKLLAELAQCKLDCAAAKQQCEDERARSLQSKREALKFCNNVELDQLKRELQAAKEQTLHDFMLHEAAQKQSHQEIDRANAQLAAATQELAMCKVQIAQLSQDLDTARTNCQLQREYMIKL